MSTDANLDLVRRGYAAFSAADTDAFAQVMSPNVVHIVPGSSPVSGAHKGLPNVLAMYGQLAELTAGTLWVELITVVSDGGNQVIAVHRSTGQRGDGRSLATDEALLFTITDGKISDMQSFSPDVAASDAFWN